MINCKECERRNKKAGGCQVFKSKPKKCWAFTTDKDWAKKVKAAVDKYKKYGCGGPANEDK